MQPRKQILVSVTGLTPQVVTETLYALHVNEGIVPTEIHLITTTNGRNRALRDLLDSQSGQFHAFCREYGLVGRIHFDASMIHVIEDGEGNGIPDIRTPEENTRAADLIVRLMQEFCSDGNAAVCVSLAGGRKTMGFFIGYALSLFGRVQDRLTHVLVSEPFENNRDFFYPTQSPREIFNARGEPLDASQAKVMLAEIPFVRLREGLPDSLLTGDAGYSETVRAAQQRILPPIGIGFDVANRTVLCGNVPVRMSPSIFAVYLWMCRRAAACEPPLRPETEQDRDQFLLVYRSVVGRNSADYENAERALRDPSDLLKYFQEKRTLANMALKKAVGLFTAKTYEIKSRKKSARTDYFLEVAPQQIHLPEPGAPRWKWDKSASKCNNSEKSLFDQSKENL